MTRCHPPGFRILLRGFQSGASAGDYKSTALVSNVLVSLSGATKTDAISVTVEHHEDQPVICLMPYTKTSSELEFGELIAQRADNNVFSR